MPHFIWRCHRSTRDKDLSLTRKLFSKTKIIRENHLLSLITNALTLRGRLPGPRQLPRKRRRESHSDLWQALLSLTTETPRPCRSQAPLVETSTPTVYHVWKQCGTQRRQGSTGTFLGGKFLWRGKPNGVASQSGMDRRGGGSGGERS